MHDVLTHTLILTDIYKALQIISKLYFHKYIENLIVNPLDSIIIIKL